MPLAYMKYPPPLGLTEVAMETAKHVALWESHFSTLMENMASENTYKQKRRIKIR